MSRIEGIQVVVRIGRALTISEASSRHRGIDLDRILAMIDSELVGLLPVR